MEMASPLVSFLKHVMEVQSVSLQLVLFVLLVLLLSLIFLKLKQGSRGGKLNLPPTPPKLPFIGNLHQLGTLPHRSFHALSKKYGPVMLLHLGHHPTVVLSSDEVVKELIKSHDITVSNRRDFLAADILFYGFKDVGFAPYGEYWRQARKVVVLELLSLKRVQSFHFEREEEVSELVNKIREACLKGVPVNISKMLLSTSNNIISRIALGRKVSNSFAELSNRFLKQFAEFSFSDYFPHMRWMDVCSGLIGRLEKSSREMDAFLDQVFEEHKSQTCGSNQSYKKDLVQILIELQKDGQFGCDVTQQHLKGILNDMFVGGTDTNFTTTEWTISELIRNPRVMKKVQEEVRRVVGKKSKIEESDINQMHYLKCVIKETLRLHPAAPLVPPRETSAPIKLAGYDISAKTTIYMNVWAIQRDPKLWDRPEEYIPDRFENNPIDFRGQDFQFIPFGTGRRGCPGINFALAGVECMLANLLCWYNWKLPNGADGQELDMEEASGLTVCRKNPLCLVPVLFSP